MVSRRWPKAFGQRGVGRQNARKLCGHVFRLAVRFKNELKRFYYATPTSFLELIQTLKIVLGARRKALSGPSLNFYGVLMVDDLTDFG